MAESTAPQDPAAERRGFLGWSETRKTLLLVSIAGVIDASYIVLVAFAERFHPLPESLDYAFVPFVRQFFWWALAAYVLLAVLGLALEKKGLEFRSYPYLAMGVISTNAVANIFLMGSTNTVGMVAVPVLVIVAASVYGRRKAVFASVYLIFLITLGFFLEWRGIIPFSPIFRNSLAEYYRSPWIYLLSGGIVALFSVVGVALVQLIEGEREKSRTELKKANAALARLDSIKRQLLEACSRDLRTPAQAVVDYANTIERNLAQLSKDDLEHACDTLRQAGHLLTEHADNILALSRSQFEEVRLQKSPLALEFLAGAICDAYVPLAAQKQITLHFDRGEGGALNRLDSLRIEQVISELVSNAIRFTPVGGRVWVRAFDSGNFQAVEVESTSKFETGPSLEDYVNRSFGEEIPGERRQRGLGLAMCRMIIDLHGGEFETDTSPQGGVVFRAIFPVERPRVVLVTESQPERAMMRRQLALLGHRVFEAFSGREAIREAQRVRPDLIVLDTEVTHDLEAMEVLRRLKAGFLTKQIPVLLYTRDARSVIEAVREGCNDYILKPGDTSELNQHIRMIFNR